MSTLDRQIDDLYRLSLPEFTRARNALVRTVRGADATRVRTLGKPTVVAWAANQVYWRARPTYDRLMAAGERLRRAQIAALGGKPADLREANAAHRSAIGDAVKEAERLAAEAGSHPAPDALMRTFEALSVAKAPPAAPGRLVEPLQPAGFEALAGVTPKIKVRVKEQVRLKPDTTPVGHSAPAVRRVRLQADPRRLQADPKRVHAEQKRKAAEDKRRAAAERRRAAAINKAEDAVERAKQKMRAAEEALRRTQDRS